MDASPKVGVTPVKQTQGLLALAFLLTGWPDLEDPGTGDIEANDRFVQELIGLKAKRVESSDPLTTILQLPKFEVALDLDVDRRLAGAARRNDFTATPNLPKQKILELARGEWIEQHDNCCLIGNAGTGKTHIATALGVSRRTVFRDLATPPA